ncbi:hypothetical protein GCM10028824_26850 [Hymenobacter segetis]|uniref:Lipoprotein n=1 Tax=Hymenobacter segetis TaxID=2025509 RepID=A0ABU9LXN6_9BACT
MPGYTLPLLLLALLTACGTQPKTEEKPARNTAVAPPVTPQTKDSVARTATPATHEQAEQAIQREPSQGSVEARPMQFRCISEEDFQQEIAIGNIMVDTLQQRFLISAEWHKPTLLYYRSPSCPNGWIETRLELVGEWLWNSAVTLDTVRLAPTGPPAVLLKFSSETSLHHWSISNEGINIIDVSAEPVLLLKAGTASHEGGYTGDDETDSTDTQREEHSFEVVQSQSIKVRNQLIVVEPAVEDGQYALHSVPPGTYRYRHGKMIRIRK